jgi:hypothetical protein
MFQAVFFLAKFDMAAKTIKSSGMCANGFFERKGKRFAIFWGKKSQKSPYLDNEFLEITRTKQGSKLLFF